MHKDKNGAILKVGDRIKNKKGEIGVIANINGVTMLVYKYENGKIRQTVVFRKVDLTQMEKVKGQK